jgi:hypothetical protein
MVRERLARYWRASMKEQETDWRFTGAVAALYLLFLIFMQVHHEMWRDEVHAWSLARIAHGFGDLVNGDRRYEGHPPLWFWYLRVWGWIFPEAWGLQVATVAAAVPAAVLLLRYAPFPRYLKVLLLLSYFFGYEYSVMCRNYVLGWLLLFLFCALYHPLRPRPVIMAVVLALLSWTSVYGLLLSGALAGFLVLERIRFWRSDLGPRRIVTMIEPRHLLAAAVLLAAWWFCAEVIEPFDPNPYVGAWNFAAFGDHQAMVLAADRFIDGMVPLRPMSIDFWGRGCAIWYSQPELAPYFGVLLLVASLAVLYRSWRVMVFYGVAFLLMEVSQTARYWGNPRHWGHYFVALVMASWLLRTLVPYRRHTPSLILLLVLGGLQFEGFLVATVIDAREVFSGGRDAAAFIRHAGLQDLPQVAGPAIFQTPATFLRRPFYAMENEEVEETIAFHNRRKQFSKDELMAKAIAVSREQHSRVVVTLWMDVLPEPPPGVRLQLLFTTRPGIVEEQFRVYLLDAN